MSFTPKKEYKPELYETGRQYNDLFLKYAIGMPRGYNAFLHPLMFDSYLNTRPITSTPYYR